MFRTAQLFVIYGCSEIGCMGCTLEVPRDRLVTKSVVGNVFENMSLRICDSGQAVVPFGMVGEIYFSRGRMFLAIFSKEELTQKSRGDRGLGSTYRTGDLGRSNEHGEGRSWAAAIFSSNCGASASQPGEVESTLRAIHGVKEAVVATRDLGSGEPSLVAYVVLEERDPPHVRILRDACQSSSFPTTWCHSSTYHWQNFR